MPKKGSRQKLGKNSKPKRGEVCTLAQRVAIISCEKSDEQVSHQKLGITLLLVIPPNFNAADSLP